MWLKMGFSSVVKSENVWTKVQLRLCCSALSSDQETATVSAVSSMANEFPGGVGLAGCWVTNTKRKKVEKKNRHQDALGPSVHPVLGSHNRKSCFHNTDLAASVLLCQAAFV